MDLDGMYASAFRRALLLTGHRQTAEDAAQEAVTRLLGQPPGAVHNPGAWLLQVVSRVCYDWLRRRSREVSMAELPERPPLQASDPAEAVVIRDEVARVQKALAQLKPRDRTLLLLRHSGASYNEIARALGCARGSVGTLLVRAERRFKRSYEALVEAPSGSGRPAHLPGR